MVEGHSVHRVATMHRQRLVGKAFRATSPNGRFTEGAKAIDGKEFYRIEAVGKNLFAFFRDKNIVDDAVESSKVVVHVHFGMAGNWAVYEGADEEVPEPTATNRLRLEHPSENLTADLSAMTVNFAWGNELYETKKAKLGQDPLRDDADPELLWTKVKKSKKSIGALIMDQSFFTGPGNIYRAEILFKAGIHPDTPGLSLERYEFDRVWQHTVSLLQRGYQTGSILTVDPDEAKRLGNPRMRRYIYNTSHCPRCSSRIQVWDIASRTCYACPKCQPKLGSSKKPEEIQKAVTASSTQDCVPFNSHCARESAETRLQESGPERLTVKELKAQLNQLGVENVPKGLRKAALVELLIEERAKKTITRVAPTADTKPAAMEIVSSEAAAAEKAAANESLAVEHIAELAPGQARRARAKAATTKHRPKEVKTPSGKKRNQSAVVTPPTEQQKKRRKSPRRSKDED